jgi:hypothetical protein
MSTGQNIKAFEYNAIRTKVEQVLNTGGVVGGTRGYGQKLISQVVAPEIDVITRAQWESLRRDIINIKIHQENPRDGSGNPIIPSVIPIPVDEPIRFGSSHPNTNFSNLIDELSVTSLNIAEGRSIISSAPNTPVLRTEKWSTQVVCNVEVSFDGYTRDDGYVVTPSNHARFFFNSGGKFRLYSRRTLGKATAQNNAWSTLLISAAVRELAALSPANLHFYNLTDQFQILYRISSSVPYAANSYTIEARCNVANNQNGEASKIFFRVTWLDDYQDTFPGAPPDDEVDGELRLFFEEFKAAGPIFKTGDTITPTGSFNIPSPSYSISAIG